MTWSRVRVWTVRLFGALPSSSCHATRTVSPRTASVGSRVEVASVSRRWDGTRTVPSHPIAPAYVSKAPVGPSSFQTSQMRSSASALATWI